MYITCEQCSTIFRLDENLLKPTGSKVRCSQCRNVFVAKPPDTFAEQVDDTDIPDDPPDQYQDNLDQELAGIDVAELDSILEEGRSTGMVSEFVDQDSADEVDLLADFDESDLDMDFESALEKDGDALDVADSVVDPEVQEIVEPMDGVGENLDFDMDFELDDWDEELIQSAEVSEDDDLDIAMDMDFELEGGVEDAPDAELPESNALGDEEDLPEETMFDENVELALDDFEDVLGSAEATDEDLPSLEISDNELEFDLDSDTPVFDDTEIDASGAVGVSDLDNLLDDTADATIDEDPADSELKDADDLDLSGLDAFLDEEDDAPGADGVSEDVELSLDDDIALASEAALGESGLAAIGGSETDDLDLADLDEVLDGDDDTPAALAEDDLLSLGDELELSLDDDSPEDAAADDSDMMLSADDEDDDLDLADLDDLLDGDEEATVMVESDDDLDLSLDEDLKIDTAPDESGAIADADGEDDDLDLADLDDLLDEDEEATVMVASDDAALSLDDDDLDLTLDEDLTVDTAVDTVASAESDDGDLDLDLGDLDDLLDEDEEATVMLASDDEELSLDDDLDLTLDEDITVDTAVDAVESVEGDDGDLDLDLGDLDDLLDGDEEATVMLASDDDDEMSLDDDLDLSLDEDYTVDTAGDESDAVTSAEGEDADIDLGDLDGLLGGDEEATVMLASNDDALSLDEDEPDLPVDEVSDPEVDENTQLVMGADDRDEFDLSDFESLLGEDAIPAESQDESSGSDENFDISGLDGILDNDKSPEDNETDDLELTLDDDLELSLDDAPSLEEDVDTSAQLVSPEAQDDDLDLSGLEETILVEDKIESSNDAVEEMDLSLEDEMQLSLEDELDDDIASDGTIDEDLGELEDLEFELDAEFEDKSIAQTDENSEDDLILALEDDQQDEAMDLSDIEKMLEDDTIVPDKADATEGAGIDLEAGGAEKWANDTSDSLGLDDDEIDLSEIEEAIDAVDGDDTDDIFVDEAQEQELELDLEEDLEEDEPESADLSESLELELEMEDADESTALLESDEGDDQALDLSDFDLSVEENQPTVETETIDGGDIQLEFQIEEGGGEPQEADTISASKTADAVVSSATTGFMEEEEAFSGEETIATEPVREQPEIGMTPPPKKAGGKKSLIAIPILVLLAVAGYFGYDYTVKSNIRIPFVSDYLNPQPKDPSGVLQLATMEINSKFIENETAGRLFVITGKVRNGYAIARKLVRLRGKLYTKGKILVKTEHTFAGLVMADQELSNSSMDDIKKRLNTTAGQDMAITLEAGKSAPFMVVFTELPADLDEFVIELVSSIKAQ